MSLDTVLINLQIYVKHLFLPMSLIVRDVLEYKLSGFRNPMLIREGTNINTGLAGLLHSHIFCDTTQYPVFCEAAPLTMLPFLSTFTLCLNTIYKVNSKL